jgi:ribonucleoside-diphosphate reductase alpha chain
LRPLTENGHGSNGHGNGNGNGHKLTLNRLANGTLDDKIRLAGLKGYEGDPCSECGQLTLVRSGACCKCDTCGASSGCS